MQVKNVGDRKFENLFFFGFHLDTTMPPLQKRHELRPIFAHFVKVG